MQVLGFMLDYPANKRVTPRVEEEPLDFRTTKNSDRKPCDLKSSNLPRTPARSVGPYGVRNVDFTPPNPVNDEPLDFSKKENPRHMRNGSYQHKKMDLARNPGSSGSRGYRNGEFTRHTYA